MIDELYNSSNTALKSFEDRSLWDCSEEQLEKYCDQLDEVTQLSASQYHQWVLDNVKQDSRFDELGKRFNKEYHRYQNFLYRSIYGHFEKWG